MSTETTIRELMHLHGFTLREEYHYSAWSKPAPNGATFEIVANTETEEGLLFADPGAAVWCADLIEADGNRKCGDNRMTLAEAFLVTSLDTLFAGLGYTSEDMAGEIEVWQKLLPDGRHIQVWAYEGQRYAKPNGNGWCFAWFNADGEEQGGSGDMTLVDALSCYAPQK